ncbi:integrase [Polynucleobacter sphagniphilus]|uniref:tyrosine-type recombinase/integrase n=1 Tax=Polynucleobacter sphagniphilus TaxID=1743169 RepID=UPI0024736094|nr:tyrosine-type recombinase/integrase [Polynucleobacter sphagniphilus]MDH6302517.1 integrase [Polynucleobacter sphagniphilus]
MSNIRIRKETGRLFLDFRVFGIRCREQTELLDSKANRKLLAKLDENIKVAVTNGSYRHEHFFPMSKRIAEVEEARLAISAPAINKAPANLALIITGMPSDQPSSTHRQSPLFCDFANQWYSEMEVGWKRSHRTTTRGALDNSLIPQFGSRPVNEIKKGDILAFRSSLAKLPGIKNKEGLSASRINHIMTPLRMILTEAADRYDFAPAFINIKPLRVGKADVQPFTMQEVQDIIRAVRADFKNYYIVRFFTGTRTSEIDGLKWQYVDFERRTISIKETIVNDYEETPKTGESERDIQMSQMVFDALLAQHKVTGQGVYVFATSAGTPISHRNISKRVWYPLLRLLGLKKRVPYQTRHTFATLMLASGEAPEWIARQMGHTTTEMLFRVYSRFIPNLTRQDGSAFERLMAAQMQDQPHPIINPDLANEVSKHSGINANSIGVNRLPKTQSRATKEIEQATQLPGPQSMTLPASPPLSSPDSPNQLPNIRINQGADTGLIANPWLEIAKHSGLSVAPSNEPTTSPEKPPGGRS